MASNLKSRLLRLRDQYDSFISLQEQLKKATTDGKRAFLNRELVFKKNQIESTINQLQREVESKIFVVYLIDPRGEQYTYLMAADSMDDLDLYIRLMQEFRRKEYGIVEIKEVPTIFKGRLKFPGI